MNWKAYNELVWAEHILAPPETYKEEALFYIKVLNNYMDRGPATMLHLGCGAAGHDFHFKKHFMVTGADISEGMLDLARKTNPEITYIKGDMRTIDLRKKFDVVIIPDSIMYMTSIADLRKAVGNGVDHLKPGGVFLVVTHLKEDFQENNFVYTGEKENIYITMFENNHIVSDDTYEASLIYLIRQGGKLSIQHEVHTLGLFSYDTWMRIFKGHHLKVNEINIDHLYDKYLLEDGEYKLKVFIGILDFDE